LLGIHSEREFHGRGYQHQDGRNRIADGNGRDGAGADEITEQRGTGDAADRGPDRIENGDGERACLQREDLTDR
jgi:hypothetical protein